MFGLFLYQQQSPCEFCLFLVSDSRQKKGLSENDPRQDQSVRISGLFKKDSPVVPL